MMTPPTSGTVQVLLAMITMVGMILTPAVGVLTAYFLAKLNADQAARAKVAIARDEQVKETLNQNTLLANQKLEAVKKAVETTADVGSRKLDEVKTALVETTATGNKKLDDVKSAMDTNTEVGRQKLDEVKHAVDTNTESRIALKETSDNTERKLDELAKAADLAAIVAKSTHSFLNSEKGALLKKYMDKCEEAAAKTDLPADHREAKIARIEYESHMTSQQIVDAQPGTDREKKGQTSPPISPSH